MSDSVEVMIAEPKICIYSKYMYIHNYPYLISICTLGRENMYISQSAGYVYRFDLLKRFEADENL